MVTRGFVGRGRRQDDAVPPGQYVTDDFPVLTAGPTEYVDAADWRLTVSDGVSSKEYDWASLHALGVDEITVDIHCVTHWSKLGTTWGGIRVQTLFDDAGVDDAAYVVATSYGGYTTNIPAEDLLERDALVATSFEGDDIDPVHGGPVRLVVPHLYFWKSAKWLHELSLSDEDEPGFWERAGYHNYGDPWREQRYYGD
jgi:DMSO/TMAO reductase YedYZ molybdopterin-dependent catalytic subunit